MSNIIKPAILYLATCIILLACGGSDNANTPNGSGNLNKFTIIVTLSDSLQTLNKTNSGLMKVSLRINEGSLQEMLITGNNATLSISDLSFDTYDVAIDVSFELPGIAITVATAKATHRFSDSSKILNLSAAELITNVLDDDNDGYSNIIELLSGSNPLGSSVLVTSATDFTVESTTPIITQLSAYVSSPEQSIIFSIAGGKDQDIFSIDSNTGILSFASPPTLKADLTENIYRVNISIGDATQSVNQEISVTVTDPFAVTVTPQFQTIVFNWQAIEGASNYRIWEKPVSSNDFRLIQDKLTQTTFNYPISVHLFDNNTLFKIEAYSSTTLLSTSMAFRTSDRLLDAIGMFKAIQPTSFSNFGLALAMSGDGKVIAIGAPAESTTPITVSEIGSCGITVHYCGVGGVYVFAYLENTWNLQTHLMPIIASDFANFGSAVSLSDDGKTLAVGVHDFDVAFPDVNGNHLDDCHKSPVDQQNCSDNSGGVFIYQNDGTAWNLNAIIKPDYNEAGDRFGITVAISGDGNTLAVGAPYEDSAAKNVNGNQIDDCEVTNTAPVNCLKDSGAAYIFRRSTQNNWLQQAYFKASNPGTALDDRAGPGTRFGFDSISIDSDGNTLAVSAVNENSPSTTINGSQTHDCVSPPTGLEVNCARNSGAVYIYRFVNNAWLPPTYIKSINTAGGQRFGETLSLSGDGLILATGTSWEASGSSGINGNPIYDCSSKIVTEQINCKRYSGAAYIYRFNGVEWKHFDYLKAPLNDEGISYGHVSLSNNGESLVVGARWGDSCIDIINAPTIDCRGGTGAAYLYHHDGVHWSSSPVLLVAADPAFSDQFGTRIAQNFDGSRLIISAPDEDSIASGFNDPTTGIRDINNETNSGAVYLY